MNLEALLEQAGRAEALLKTIANRHRLMILCNLYGGEHSVSALQQKLGLSQSALSQHLAKLRSEGFVHTRRDAQTIYYTLTSHDVTRVIATLHDLYCSDLCLTQGNGADTTLTPLEGASL
jgi:DNA-binding transcriptional ArsR family regulator